MIYLVKTYKDYIDDNGLDIYKSTKLEIPKPELYVLYTGDRKTKPTEITLGKEFFPNETDIAIEVRAKVLYGTDEESSMANGESALVGAISGAAGGAVTGLLNAVPVGGALLGMVSKTPAVKTFTSNFIGGAVNGALNGVLNNKSTEEIRNSAIINGFTQGLVGGAIGAIGASTINPADSAVIQQTTRNITEYISGVFSMGASTSVSVVYNSVGGDK